MDTLEDGFRILGLFGKYRPLSNFHMEPLVVEGRTFPCSEAAYMAEKTDSPEWKDRFTKVTTALQAKQLGREVPLKSNWDDVKTVAMRKVLFAKFTQCEYLKELLLSTGEKYLEETNWWKDTFWGVFEGVGKNTLGILLMEIRKELTPG